MCHCVTLIHKLHLFKEVIPGVVFENQKSLKQMDDRINTILLEMHLEQTKYCLIQLLKSISLKDVCTEIALK